MDIEFLTPEYVDSGYFLTSRLNSVTARVNASRVQVEIVYNPDDNPQTIFSNTLYPFNNIVEIYAVGSLVEEFLRSVDKFFGTFEIRVDNASLRLNMLYCEYLLHEEFLPDNTFLHSAAASVVHADSFFCLSHTPPFPDSYTVKIVGHATDGSLATAEHQLRSDLPHGVSARVKSVIDAAHAAGLADVAYFSVDNGRAQHLFYISKHPSHFTFYFRNIFNVPEYLDIVGVVKRKTSVDSDSATCNNTVMQYNRTVARTYEISTAPLTEHQVRAVEQLIASHSAQIDFDDYAYPIIITDHTCEPSSDNENLVSVKFTFRYASERPALYHSEADAILADDPHIFNNPFSPEYS